MALLDLQGMKEKSADDSAKRNSGASKGCGNGGNHTSGLSLLLC